MLAKVIKATCYHFCVSIFKLPKCSLHAATHGFRVAVAQVDCCHVHAAQVTPNGLSAWLCRPKGHVVTHLCSTRNMTKVKFYDALRNQRQLRLNSTDWQKRQHTHSVKLFLMFEKLRQSCLGHLKSFANAYHEACHQISHRGTAR